MPRPLLSGDVGEGITDLPWSLDEAPATVLPKCQAPAPWGAFAVFALLDNRGVFSSCVDGQRWWSTSIRWCRMRTTSMTSSAVTR